MTFNDFAGNLLLKEQLYSLFKSKRVPHSMIFQGPIGSGKKTIADILAREIVCSSDDIFLCEDCPSCKKAFNKTHPDIIYPEKTGVLESFNVETIRHIREDAYIIPNESLYKVYIFQDANNMNVSAQNALLKLIEEPPNNVVFIFTCTQISSFLDTIKSRSQIFSVENVEKTEAVDFICKEYPDFNKNEIENAVFKSEGNIGRAIELLNVENFDNSFNLAKEIVNTIFLKNEFETLKLGSKVSTDRKILKIFLCQIVKVLRDLIVDSTESNISQNNKSISKENIIKIIDIINEHYNLLEYNVNTNLLITSLFLNIHSSLESISISNFCGSEEPF